MSVQAKPLDSTVKLTESGSFEFARSPSPAFNLPHIATALPATPVYLPLQSPRLF